MPPAFARAAALLLVALVAACVRPPEDSRSQEVRRQLTGTWLREYQEGQVLVRRILVLEPSGRFTEAVLASEADGGVVRNRHSGEWHFDGLNLKRRYTLIDGRKPSAPVFPYAAFQVSFESRRVFVGTDNVRRRQVRYERVTEGTQP